MADPAPSERSPAPNDTAPRPAGQQRPAGQRPGGQPSTHRPSFADDGLFQLLQSKNVEVTAKAPPQPSLLERLLVGFGPTLLLVGLFVLLARRAAASAGGLGGLGGIGRSRARRYEPEG